MANITIDKATADALFDLFNNVEAADTHYKRCQSDEFRVHVQSVYKNPGVSGAFEKLRKLIEKANEPEKVTKAPESPRKGVLGG